MKPNLRKIVTETFLILFMITISSFLVFLSKGMITETCISLLLLTLFYSINRIMNKNILLVSLLFLSCLSSFGSKNDTLFVNNVNDKRLIAYNDSMKSFLLGVEEHKRAKQMKNRLDAKEGERYMQWRENYVSVNKINPDIKPITFSENLRLLYIKEYQIGDMIYGVYWRPDVYIKPRPVAYKPIEKVKSKVNTVTAKPISKPIEVKEEKKSIKVIYTTKDKTGKVSIDSTKTLIVSLGYKF